MQGKPCRFGNTFAFLFLFQGRRHGLQREYFLALIGVGGYATGDRAAMKLCQRRVRFILKRQPAVFFITLL